MVAGFRWRGDGDGVSSLLLGLFDDAGVLHHVGVTGALARQTRHEVTATVVPKVCELEGHPWEHGFALEGGPQGRLRGAAGRWTPDLPRDWFPVEPVWVAEVGYDQLDGYRFRHPSSREGTVCGGCRRLNSPALQHGRPTTGRIRSDRIGQTRFTDTRLAHQDHNATIARGRALQGCTKVSQLRVAADELE